MPGVPQCAGDGGGPVGPPGLAGRGPPARAAGQQYGLLSTLRMNSRLSAVPQF